MKKTYTLTQLVESIRSVINNSYGENTYWVSCELVKVNIKAGHYYLELADTQNDIHSAQMRAVIWRTQVLALQTNFGAEFQQLLQNGNRILFRVSVTFHEIYGLSLTVHDLDPAFTYGEIERKKKQTIEQLQKEGLFDLQKQLKLPLIVKKLVLVGSPDTSGYRDFLSEMRGNPIFRNFTIKEIATSVQGDKALAEICAALQEADSYAADAIVLIRGGGSKMDLNVFNDYQICKTIALLHMPLITGIGHETDEVVADMVAHTRQITPTAVAKFLYVKVGAFRSDLQTGLDRVLTQALTQLALATERFTNTNQYLTHYFQNIITAYRTDLQEQLHGVQLHATDCIAAQKGIIELSLNRGVVAAINQVRVIKELEVPAILERVIVSAKNQIALAQLHLNGLDEKLEFLNPLKLLEVGYTISSIGEVDISRYKGEIIGKELITLTNQMTVYSTITKIKRES